MILQSLCQLYDRLATDVNYDIPPPGYSMQRITFKVIVRLDGSLLEIQDIRDFSRKKPVPRLIVVPGGDKPSGKVTAKSVHKKVHLLRNDLPYLVGLKVKTRPTTLRAEPPKFLERAEMEFQAFRTFHQDIEDAINDPHFSAVCRFLARWNPTSVSAPPGWLEFKSGQGVFQIAGQAQFVHDRPAVKRWWDKHRSGRAGSHRQQCLVTGEDAPIARIHKKIKRLPGAEAAGATIVGCNDPAYESYGKTQSHNSPVSEDAAFRYATVLNELLGRQMRDKHCLSLADITILFWTSKPTPTEDIFARFASRGSGAFKAGLAQDESLRQKLHGFLNALRTGQDAYTRLEEDPEHTSFFLLGLSPNVARISVRFFYHDSLSRLLLQLRKHYHDIQIDPQPASGRRKADPEFPSAQLLLDQTARMRSNIPPILAAPLLRAIVSGAPYPHGLFLAVVRRIRVDHRVDYARACVVKGYLKRNRNTEVSMSLDIKKLDPAYRLGRLFAALEKTQLDAQGELNATIRDRFYSSASATPQAVFPRLLRTYQHHLAKLEGGRKVNREKLVQEILDPLQAFPAHLFLPEQGLFALGYYHQTRAFYKTKED